LICCGSARFRPAMRRRGAANVTQCLERYLANAPPSVGLVVLLGADKKYVQACRKRLGGTPLGAEGETPYTYSAMGKSFVHVPHPSGQAGGFRAVFNGKRSPRNKEMGMIACRKQALAAVARFVKQADTATIGS
jgi:hypothetical protein